LGRARIYLFDDSWVQPNYRVVMGYRGFGAVGLISTLHLVNSLGMEKVGIIVTSYHPEYVVMEDNGPAYPYEIYVDRKSKLLVVVSREIPHDFVRVDYARKTARFLSEIKAELLVLIGGLDSRLRRDASDLMRWLPNRFYTGRPLEDKLFERDLMIIGPLALQLMMSEAYRIPAITLLPYAMTDAPDPAAAAVAIDRINKLLGINVPTEQLLADATKIQEELSKLEEALKSEEEKEKRSKGGLYV
jgi:uncharacterized protein